MIDLTSLTLGKRIQALRKEQALTQEQLAEHMGVTPQAVSKWENDQSCPDIMSLPLLAKELHTTVDTLLTGQVAEASPAIPAKKPEELIVRMMITTEDGDRVCLNLPFTVFHLGTRYGLVSFTINASEEADDHLVQAMKDVDFRAIADAILGGARGVLLNIENTLVIWTE